jgi:glutaredoxin 3
MATVVFYSTSLCPYCALARRLLERRGVEYQERRLTRRAADRERLAEIAGGGRTYPQVLIDGEPVGGYRELRRLERDGTLGRILGEAG